MVVVVFRARAKHGIGKDLTHEIQPAINADPKDTED
jgi:hypothetical protein